VRTSKRNPPLWIRIGTLVVHIAGLAHDWGKGSLLFQNKLKGTQPMRDPVRHEWLSAWLLEPFLFSIQEPLQGAGDWDLSAKQAAKPCFLPRPLKDGIATFEDVISFLVVSHHRLTGTRGRQGACDASGHIHVNSPNYRDLLPSGESLSALGPGIRRARKLYARLKGKSVGEPLSQSPDFFMGLAWLGRAALILADHSVSAVRYPKLLRPIDPNHPAANTIHEKGENILNQPLAWHLNEVGESAGRMLWNMHSWRPDGLAEGTLDVIRQRSSGSFSWQNSAEDLMMRMAENADGPVLVLNTAGTGCGKTRANGRMAAALSLARGRPVRFCAGLNLRSLTLQTFRAWQKQWSLDESELACVIGDGWAQKLFDAEQEDIDDDGNPLEVEYESFGAEVPIPAWLEQFAKRKPILRRILLPPVLVSTMDFLIDAANPGRQGNHALALLRLKGSTLILDEVDSYDTDAMVAVMRLVRVGAMLGSDVITSSATLPAPLASGLMQAFSSGARIHHALQNMETPTSAFKARIAMVNENEALPVENLPEGDGSWDTVKASYRDFMLSATQRRKKVRIPRIADIEEGDSAEARFNKAVGRECRYMHEHHGWACGSQEKRVSFGLVRVAHIRTAIQVAKALAKVPHFRVCCYHSQELRLVRHLKEAALDHLLSRHPSLGRQGRFRKDPTGNAHIADDPAIAAILENSDGDNLAFIVVATPVEEIGRDHDFDWAVIEPSGARSIVQCAGRVNRHRLLPVGYPNIAILRYNMRQIKNLAAGIADETVFYRPGLESTEQKYKSHDLHELVNQDLFAAVDSGLIFDERHMIVKEETVILEDVLREPLRTVTAERPNWMARGHYDKFVLRAQDELPNVNVYYNMEDRRFYEVINGQATQRQFPVTDEPNLENDWLGFDENACENLRQSLGMSFQAGYSVQVRRYSNDTPVIWYRSLGLAAASLSRIS
jgi:CRISPR-associated endonuclease/helicase Cas3